MSNGNNTEENLQKELQELRNTIEGFQFCQRYSTDKKSYQYAMKFIQHFELYIYKVMILLPFVRTYFKKKNVSAKHTDEKVEIKKIAVFIHAYYPELLTEIYHFLKNIHCEYDLYINIPESLPIEGIAFPQNLKKLYRLKNMGKDMASFIHFVKDTGDLNYDLVLKLHTKKSSRLDNQDGNIWRKCLLNSLIGNPTRVAAILESFSNKKVGIIGTRELYLNYNIRQENMVNFENLLRILKIKNKNFGYHAGSMFWFKPKALMKILHNPTINFDMFKTSKNQDDGDIEHAFERIFVLCAKSEGFEVQNFSIALD